MKSPFPGMDPYLERHWLDLHPELIVKSRGAVQRQLGGDLVARIEERLVVEDTLGYTRGIRPDIHVIDKSPFGVHDIDAGEAGGAPVAVASRPVHLTELAQPITERFIEIIDVSTGGRVITVIEFVSPSNKLPGDGQKQYRQKQDECFNAKVSLVEIDLTRGDRTLLCHRWSTARQHESTYQASAWNAASPQGIDLYPIPLRHALPVVVIPLRPRDTPASLDLQAILAACYADARYDRTIDYRKPLDPPLDANDAAWVHSLTSAAV